MKKAGFIGVGNIANAIISGAVTGKILEPENIVLYDIDVNKLSNFAKKGFIIADSVKDLADSIDLLFLTVKPQILASVLEELKPHLKDETLIISPVAGVKINKINKSLGGNKKIIRVMPNTPLTYSAGATAISVGEGVNQGMNRDDAEKLVLGTMLGTAKMMLESDLNADELIKAVASPGGTTEAGLKTMDEQNFDSLVSKIISAAVNRSKELSE